MQFNNYITESIITESINDKGIFKAVFMAGNPGAGKAQPLYSNILTINGWKTMGEINVGDILISPTGNTTKVLQIHEQGICDIYRIKLFDGRYVDCTLNHLWKVWLPDKTLGYCWKIKETKYFIETMETNKNWKNMFKLPLTNPIDFIDNEMKIIDPYLMGVLLGDGCLKQGSLSFTTIDNEIVKNVNKILNPDFKIKKYKINYFIRLNGNNKKHYYINFLKNIGLYEKCSYDKFIPDEYKYTTIKNRIKIINGLLDTDGYVSNSGYIQYYTTSIKLANDFRFLIWSIGGNTTLRIKKTSYKKNNKIVKCKDCYCITIYHHTPEILFSLKRKVDRLNINLQKRNLNHKLRCKINNIEYVGKYEAKCITVDKDDGLYLTDDFIVTHNSYTLSKISNGAISPRIVNIDKWIEFNKVSYETPGHDHAKVITKNELYLYVNSMLPLFVDTTSTNTIGVVRKRNILERIGYDTALIYVQTSLETSLKRVEKRNQMGPRVVSLDKVREYYIHSMKIKKFLQHSFNLFMEVNNDDDELTDEAVLKAFNRMSWFFNSPVKNRIGNDIIETMITNKWKYLSDGIYSKSELYSKIGPWYRGL